MHTVLVVVHVISMVSSIALMLGALVLGILGKQSAVNSATVGMIFTTLGAVTGTILLLSAPMMQECLILTAYLVVATTLYYFGFGGGFAENARFIRSSASVQKR